MDLSHDKFFGAYLDVYMDNINRPLSLLSSSRR